MAPTVWYYVRDLESASRRFYRETLLFEKLVHEREESWVTTERGAEMRLHDVFDPDGNRLQSAQELRS